jgi:hypothetical protein
MMTASQSIASQNAEAFADKIFHAALGTMETFNFYLGDRPGLVRCTGGGASECC